MSGVAASRVVSRLLLVVAAGLLLAPQVRAFEAFDGRLQAHGFFETQLRTLSADFSEDWDVAQWYMVFNLELEMDFIEDTWGPIDLLSAYVRAEVRYDCVYPVRGTGGCGMFKGMNTWGDKSKSLPRRLSSGDDIKLAGELFIENESRLSGSNTDPVYLADVAGFKALSDIDAPEYLDRYGRVDNRPDPERLWANNAGITPWDYTFENFLDFKFTHMEGTGGSRGGFPVTIMGPWLPKNFVHPIAVLSDRVNPFDSSRMNPVTLNPVPYADAEWPLDSDLELRPWEFPAEYPHDDICLSGDTEKGCRGGTGSGANPFRPIPIFAEDASKFNQGDARFNKGEGPYFLGDEDTIPYQLADPSNPFGALAKNKDDLDIRYSSDITGIRPLRDPVTGDVLVDPGTGQPYVDPVRSDRQILAGAMEDHPDGYDPDVWLAAKGNFVVDDPATGEGHYVEPEPWDARGLFVPSPSLVKLMKSGDLDSFEFNFREAERKWNRGASQQDTKELKEAYLDIETLDSRLWMRIGLQSIVWGKTELFRTTDQFNPQDLALASLPSLEEARIAQWAFRGVFSLYEVGPLEDVRLELAFNFDDFEPNDLGACGEAFTPNPVCSLTFGAFAHSYTGVGIAGVDRPPAPWQSLDGWEIGGRIEFRWERFSFAISDFYGYNDMPHLERIHTYQRNVDPYTGLPLKYDNRRPEKRRAALAQPVYFRTQEEVDAYEEEYGPVPAGQPSLRFDPNAAPAVYPLNPARTAGCAVGQGIPGTGATGPMQARWGGDTQGYMNTATDGQLFRALGSDPVPTGNCLTWGPTNLTAQSRNNRDRAVPGSALWRTDYVQRDDNGRVLYERINNKWYPATDSTQGETTNALHSQHANQSVFTWVCSTSVGFVPDLDKKACALTVFGSPEKIPGSPLSVGRVIGRLLGGDAVLNKLLTEDTETQYNRFNPNNPPTDPAEYLPPVKFGSRFIPMALPIAMLHQGAADERGLRCRDPNTGADCGGDWSNFEQFLSNRLSPEQEALLGCGPFWGTSCDDSGIDLLNAEASALLQSLAGTDGTLASISLKQQGAYPEGTYIENRTTGEPIYLPFKDVNSYRADEGLQPGTLPWAVSGIGGPVCTTTDLGGPEWSLLDSDNNLPGAHVQLPGCRRKWVDTGRQTQVRRLVKNSFPSLDPDAFYNDFDGNPDWLPVVNAPQYDFPDKVYFFNESSPAVPTLPGGSRASEDPSCYWEGTTPASRPDCFRGGQPLASRRAAAIHRELGADSPGLSSLRDLVVPYASEMAALSENYEAMLVAFSAEFLEGLRTVGDLADPYGIGVSGGSDPDKTFDYDGDGEIYNKYIPPFEPGENSNLTEARSKAQDAEDRAEANIWHRRRYIAELLFAYCGAEYGLGDCKIEDRYNIYDQAETQVELPGIEQLRNLYTNDPRAKCFKAESDPSVCADVQPDDAYYGSLPQGIVANPASPLYAADADLRQLYLNTLQFITTRSDCDPNDKEQEGCVWARDKDERDQWEFLEGDDAYLITNTHCSLLEPQYCGLIQSMFNIAGVKRNTLRAGGNGTYGRRTFQWHSGGEVVVRYDRRNVLGFSMDFTEDRTKTNFGVEATWIGGVPNMDSDAWNNTTDTDDFNLTISVDRPTFINFLNANRTFFFNSQWFFQYRRGYRSSFPGNGPWNVLATFTAMTGYFQDRLNPAFTFVHDFQSSSGAFLPSVSYRFDEKFSATIGLLMFYGRPQWVDMPLNEIGPARNRSGSRAYYDTVENGLSLVRDRDEVFLRLRYTF